MTDYSSEKESTVDWEKVRLYGEGKIPGSELTEKEMDMASDALDALDWAE